MRRLVAPTREDYLFSVMLVVGACLWLGVIGQLIEKITG